MCDRQLSWPREKYLPSFSFMTADIAPRPIASVYQPRSHNSSWTSGSNLSPSTRRPSYVLLAISHHHQIPVELQQLLVLPRPGDLLAGGLLGLVGHDDAPLDSPAVLRERDEHVCGV